MTKLQSKKENSSLLEVELAQVFETLRYLFTLVVSAFTLIVTANITLLGFAISNKIALAIAPGAIFPLGGLALLKFVGRMFIPLLFTAMSIEKTTGDYSKLFFWSFTATMTGSALHRFQEILDEPDDEQRFDKLYAEFNTFVPFGSYTVWVLVLLALAQPLVSLFAYFVLGWK